ncbi:hypothetical protein D9M71_783500 [compost metagenome]
MNWPPFAKVAKAFVFSSTVVPSLKAPIPVARLVKSSGCNFENPIFTNKSAGRLLIISLYKRSAEIF